MRRPGASKSVIAAYLTFFPVVMDVLRGLESVDRDVSPPMRSYAATDRQIFRRLPRLPASVPYLFTALKISATASVIGAIIGECACRLMCDIGVQIVVGSQYNTFNPGFLWATIIAAVLLGLIAYAAVAPVSSVSCAGNGREA